MKHNKKYFLKKCDDCSKVYDLGATFKFDKSVYRYAQVSNLIYYFTGRGTNPAF